MSDTAAACHHSFQGKLCLETKGEKTNDPIFFLMNTSPTSDPAKASGGGEMPGKGTGRLVCMTSALLFCFSFFSSSSLLSFVLSSLFQVPTTLDAHSGVFRANYRNLPDSTQQVEATTAASTRAPRCPCRVWDSCWATTKAVALSSPQIPKQAYSAQFKKEKKNPHSYQDCGFRF